MVKQLTLAREMAILGDYDTALSEFKLIFGHVHNYIKKYDANDLSVPNMKIGGAYSAKNKGANNSA